MKAPKIGARWGAFQCIGHTVQTKAWRMPHWDKGQSEDRVHTYVTLRCVCGEVTPKLLVDPITSEDPEDMVIPGEESYIVEYLDCGCGAASQGQSKGVLTLHSPTGRLRRIDMGSKRTEPKVIVQVYLPLRVKQHLQEIAITNRVKFSHVIQMVLEDYIQSVVDENAGTEHA